MFRKSLLIAATAMLPGMAMADVAVSVQVPGISIAFGDRDNRGYYWDGGVWRSPVWWQQRYPRYVVKREVRYYPVPVRERYYWHGRDSDRRYHHGKPPKGKGYYSCPPGQGKKGRC